MKTTKKLGILAVLATGAIATAYIVSKKLSKTEKTYAHFSESFYDEVKN